MSKQNIRPIGKKPQRLDLQGDPSKVIEKAENIITFPGGYIGIIRDSNDEYWVHIGLTTPELCEPVGDAQFEKLGVIDRIRVDKDRDGIPYHLAAHVKTAKPDSYADYSDLSALAEKYAQIAGKVGLRPKLDNVKHSKK